MNDGGKSPMAGRVRLIAAGVGVVLAVGVVAALAVALNTAQSRPVASRQWDHSFDGVTRVVVRIDEGSLRVSAAPTGTRATVTTHLRWNTDREPRYEARLDGDTLVVRVHDCAGRFLRATCAADVEMTVPADAPLDLATDSAGIEAAGFRGPVHLAIDSGDADLRDLTGPVRARLDSGDLTALGLAAPTVDVEVDSGNVRLEFAAPPDDVRTRTDSSDVVILLPDGSGPYAVQTKTDRGTARVEVSTGDSAGRRISSTNDSGDITVAYTGRGR